MMEYIGRNTNIKYFINENKRDWTHNIWMLCFLMQICVHFHSSGGKVFASEFPGRECCDSAPPPPPQYYTTTSTSPVPPIVAVNNKKHYTHTTKLVPRQPQYPDYTVPPTTGDLGGSIAMKNCLLSRKLCAGDPACRSILEIIPRVCGPETVACSTVTVNKCLAALRTVRGFPYFSPVCLCREPHLDHDCNAFREFIFDHPCEFVYKDGEQSPYAVHALPTCDYAARACENLPACKNTYDRFRETCKVRDGHCRMKDSEACLWAWTQLKQLPMFGCICPDDRQKHHCEKIFSIIHHNPCVVSVIPFDNASFHAVDTQIQNPLVNSPDGATSQNASRASDVLGGSRQRARDPNTRMASTTISRIPSLHSTCETALEGCLADQGCRRLLDPVLATCNNNCRRELCMDSLQTFYRNVESRWAMEVALCLCKKTNQTANTCLLAQEKLHPSCARRPAGTAPLLCSTLATSCKDDGSCRHRLEFYEQACAVDSDTRRCAGSTAECRRALLGILGTRLRNLCTCAAHDPRETYTCLDWQRILWFNPCVVESQTDYHREMLSALGPGEEATTSPNVFIRMTTDNSLHGGVVGKPKPLNAPNAPTYRPPRGEKYWEYPQKENNQPAISKPKPTTTTTTTTSTLPPNYCKKELRNGKIDYIVEGGSKRYYKMSDYCSELCQCFVGENLVCNVLACIPSNPCETQFAIYQHNSPAYQMHRGQCICYSESFICEKARDFNKTEGTFLLIGYSKKEEELLHPFTRQTVSDTLPKLQKLYDEAEVNINAQRAKRVSSEDEQLEKTSCELQIFDSVEENIVIRAILEDTEEIRDNMTAYMLHREKEECEPALEVVSQLINKKNPSVYHDVLLSMFIISDVQSYLPPLSASAINIAGLSNIILLLLCFLLIRIVSSPS